MDMMDRIFQESILEFKEHGVKFTMDSLAKRMGISKRTLYENIATKNDVMELVINRTFEDVKQQQKIILENKDLDTVSKIKKLFTIVPTYANVLDYRRMNELKTNYPVLCKEIERRLDSDWEKTIELLQKAMDQGILRKTNIVIIKMLLVEVYEQLINGEVLIKSNISYEEAMNEVISIIFDGLW